MAHRVSRDEGGVVRSPAPAMVVATPLEVGAEVEAGAPVLVLESMKMETVLRAPFKARLKECVVSVGSQVEAGAPLLRLEPIADDDGDAAQEATEAVELDLPAERAGIPARERAARGLQDLRSLLLGFDVDPHDERRVLADYLAARKELAATGQRPLADEVELIDVVRRPRRAEPQQAGGRGRRRRPRAQCPRVLPHLPAEPRRRPAPGCRRRSRPSSPRRSGTTASPTWSAPRSWKRPCSGSSSPSSARRPTPTVVIALLRVWLREVQPGRRAARARGSRAGAAGRRDTGALPGGVRPRPRGGVRLVRPAAAAPQPRPRLRRRPQAPAPPRRAPGRSRTARSAIAEMVRSTEPLVRLLGQRLARAGPGPRADAGGADQAVLRQQGPGQRPHQRRRPAAPSWSPSAPAPGWCPPR